MKWSVFVAFVLFLRAQQSDAQNVVSPNSEKSGVSVAFCDDFETNGIESFEISAETLEPVDGRFLFSTTIDPSRGMQRYDLPVLIPQKGVKHIELFSTSGEDICLKAVSVDTSIFVDSPTNFQTICSAEEKTSSPPCKEFKSKLKPLKSDVEKVSKSQNSGVSVAFCDDFEATGKAFFEISAETLEPVDGRFLFSTTIDPSRGMQRYDLPVLIPQKGVKHIKVFSTSGEDLCLQAVAVDTNIYVDLPTNFKTTCSAEEETSIPPCKEFESELEPLRVCPNKISELLKREQLIDSLPSPDPEARPFEVPTYHIADDMAQASYAIVEGIADLSRKGVKEYMSKLKSAMKFSKLFRVQGTLTGISSILGAVGPALGIFGGITSILTTFLTPNPFDMLAEYLQEEFTALHNHLDRVEGELKELIMAEGAMTRMADAVASIRYSLREFDDIAKSLKKNPVCGTDNLIREYSVNRFVYNYNQRDTEHKLLDLLEVEQGLLPLTYSLLKPFMKTYCRTNPGKVKRFMTDISTYAFLGTQAQLFFTDLICTMYKLRNCDSKTSMWKGYLKKLLYEANALIVALESPTEGFYQFFKDDLRREVSREVEGESNTEEAKLNRVTDLFFYFLNDPENWPKRCIVDSDNDKEVVAYVVVKTNANVPYKKMGYLSPYFLHERERLELVKMKIANLPHKEDETDLYILNSKFLDWDCGDNTKNFEICNVSNHLTVGFGFLMKLYKHPNGKLIYMEINPGNGYLNFTIQPVDVFKNADIVAPLWLGCWSGKDYIVNDRRSGSEPKEDYACPTPDKNSDDSAPTENRFLLFYKNEPNYPKDESEEG